MTKDYTDEHLKLWNELAAKIRELPTMATLTVKMVGENDTWWNKPSGCLKPIEGNEYYLVLNPKDDMREVPEARGNLASIMAHELGHFIYGVLDMPDNGRVAEEKAAWELAEKMVPVNQNLKAATLGGYNRDKYYWKAQEIAEKLFSKMLKAGVNPADYANAVRSKDEKTLAGYRAKLADIMPELSKLAIEGKVSQVIHEMKNIQPIQPEPDDM